MQMKLTIFFWLAQDHQEGDLRQERLYFFQFPAPFPTFISPPATRSDPGEGSDVPASSEGKHVSFSADTKPPAAVPEDVDKEEKPPAHVDGEIGQLEIYQSGAVKMRLANGILLDVSVSPPPPFTTTTTVRFLNGLVAGNRRNTAIVLAASRPR
jgi:DNA-directed RNA polymerase III subunit RPC4